MRTYCLCAMLSAYNLVRISQHASFYMYFKISFSAHCLVQFIQFTYLVRIYISYGSFIAHFIQCAAFYFHTVCVQRNSFSAHHLIFTQCAYSAINLVRIAYLSAQPKFHLVRIYLFIIYAQFSAHCLSTAQFSTLFLNLCAPNISFSAHLSIYN